MMFTSCTRCLQRLSQVQSQKALSNAVSRALDSLQPTQIQPKPDVDVDAGKRFKSTNSGDHHSKIKRKNQYVKSNRFSTTVADLQEEIAEFELVEYVNDQVAQQDTGRLFAVVYIQGKQRKVTAEDILVIRKHIEPEIGERIRLNKVLMVGGRDFSLIGRPILHADTVRVEATVLEKTLSSNRTYYYYRRRKNISRFRLNRETETMLRINSIELTPVMDKT